MQLDRALEPDRDKWVRDPFVEDDPEPAIGEDGEPQGRGVNGRAVDARSEGQHGVVQMGNGHRAGRGTT